VKATKTSGGGGGTPVCYTIPRGIVIFLVFHKSHFLHFRGSPGHNLLFLMILGKKTFKGK